MMGFVFVAAWTAMKRSTSVGGMVALLIIFHEWWNMSVVDSSIPATPRPVSFDVGGQKYLARD
ncbi:hypothetical protein GA0061098_1014180 [Bradyrhizobium shewense]|uniref:Uncharacterized protein n=1 Tax=Bradyrhizobium shewense TaxID=1761772 RepID=A0A1C3XE52_9BRAD|nr:hypothetical protein [Bradyrhizobium shewense]SCB50567.1 hypothetical protein GA0061098_1014180 [Bradyrhizobium shewense]